MILNSLIFCTIYVYVVHNTNRYDGEVFKNFWDVKNFWRPCSPISSLFFSIYLVSNICTNEFQYVLLFYILYLLCNLIQTFVRYDNYIIIEIY